MICSRLIHAHIYVLCPVFSCIGIGPLRGQEKKGIHVPESEKEMCWGSLFSSEKNYEIRISYFLSPAPMEDDKAEKTMPLDGQPTASKEFC